MSEKIKAKVKWFNESSGKNYFIHFSAILTNGFKTLAEGILCCLNLAKVKRTSS